MISVIQKYRSSILVKPYQQFVPESPQRPFDRRRHLTIFFDDLSHITGLAPQNCLSKQERREMGFLPPVRDQEP